MALSPEVVKHAEDLLYQVKKLASSAVPTSKTDSEEDAIKQKFETYQSTHNIEDLCIKILQGVLGESLYSLTLAGHLQH